MREKRERGRKEGSSEGEEREEKEEATASHLVMSSSSTHFPDLTQAARLSAPSVSSARTGVSPQPTRWRPSNTPFMSPPPPTDSTTRSGTMPRSWCCISSTMDA